MPRRVAPIGRARPRRGSPTTGANTDPPTNCRLLGHRRLGAAWRCSYIGWVPGIVEKVLGSKHQRDVKALAPLITQINEQEAEMLGLDDADFGAETDRLRQDLARDRSASTRRSTVPDGTLMRAFALAREAARRALGQRMFDCQLMGGIVLHRGAIVEMKTGEGKTLSSVPAAYLNSLVGKVHVVTVNDYLAQRDSEWMGRVFTLLGVSVGVVVGGTSPDARRAAYDCDITYGTNNEFGFDYLRDNLEIDPTRKVQQGHDFCIVDEIDSILIDEARTPLIISGPSDDDTAMFSEVNALVNQLSEVEKDPDTGEYPDEAEGYELHGDFKLEEKGKRVSLTDEGMASVERVLQGRKLIRGSLYSDENFELIHYMTQSLRAHHLYKRDVDYVVQDGQVQIVDEFTGRILHGRRYSDGLHQAIEAKEGIRILRRNTTVASITFQNYFKLYQKLAGMTGTADTEATEFGRIYGLDVVVVPTNRPVIRADEDDVIYLNEEQKMQAICDEIADCHERSQPVLVGTVSIEKSEALSQRLLHRGVRHEVLNAKNHEREAAIIADAGSPGAVTIATNMAGRGTDIQLGGNPEFAAKRQTGGDPEAYRRVLDKEMAVWREAYERVKDAGGLHVLGTERHESRRIDNQLRGRSGRQGDPGSSRFYISLDDQLMRLFGENVRNMMSKVGFADGEPLAHPWINKSLERAQRRVEERNFEIRKQLLEFDDVLNEQRRYVYSKRDEIAGDEDLVARVGESAEEILEELAGDDQTPTDPAHLIAGVRERFHHEPNNEPAFYANLGPVELQRTLLAELDAALQEKAAAVSHPIFNAYVRSEYLRSIDGRWREHLEHLEALQEAVRLRAYSQKNPLLEYKLEGFQMFDDMLRSIRHGIAEKVHKIRLQLEPHPATARRDSSALSNMITRHDSVGQFGAGAGAAAPGRPQPTRTPAASARGAGGGAGGAGRSAAAAPAAGGAAKVGRNDPCPCGSGKKYKHCHGG
ncbi:MAG: preprotein translocase subunit SecA [Acidobacteria bacterium]|nr:preprotein translocase subunit SecA [Acidobacteriota bacterium]